MPAQDVPPPTSPRFVDATVAAHLLRAAQECEHGAMSRLIQLCQPLVQGQACRHARHPGDVDDIVQDVWERLLRNAADIRNPDVLVAWLVTVTRRVAMDVTRRGERAQPMEIVDQVQVEGAEEEAIRRCSRAETRAGVRTALDRIGESDRSLLMMLHGDDGLRYREISHRVQRPIGSLGPTRMRLLGNLRSDPAVARLRVTA